MKTRADHSQIIPKSSLPYHPSSPSARQMEVSSTPEVSWPTSSSVSLMLLPPELRDLIFRLYFLSLKNKGATCPVGIDRKKLAQNHIHSFSGMYIAYPPLLHANKVIRHEAAKHFFAIMTFEIRFPRLPHICHRETLARPLWPSNAYGSKWCDQGLGSPHDQCCSFLSRRERIREMLLSEPLSTPMTASIRQVALDAEALCPRVFLILGKCCPALASLTLDVGKWPNMKNDQVDIPRLAYYSSLLDVGINYLPQLTRLAFHVSEWCWSGIRPAIDFSRIYNFLQQRCRNTCKLFCLTNHHRLHHLSISLVSITDRPLVINVCGMTMLPTEELTSHRKGYPHMAAHHPFDNSPAIHS